MSFLPLLPMFLIGGLFFAAPAVQKAREAAKQALAQQEQKQAELKREEARAHVPPPAPKPEPSLSDRIVEGVKALEPKPQPAPTPLPEIKESPKTETPPPDVHPQEMPAVKEPAKEAEPTMRTWTDASGKHKTEAEFVSMTAGKVKLRKADGSIVTLPMDKLSKADQKWIRDRAKR
jgi:hypothetical protein